MWTGDVHANKWHHEFWTWFPTQFIHFKAVTENLSVPTIPKKGRMGVFNRQFEFRPCHVLVWWCGISSSVKWRPWWYLSPRAMMTKWDLAHEQWALSTELHELQFKPSTKTSSSPHSYSPCLPEHQHQQFNNCPYPSYFWCSFPQSAFPEHILFAWKSLTDAKTNTGLPRNVLIIRWGGQLSKTTITNTRHSSPVGTEGSTRWPRPPWRRWGGTAVSSSRVSRRVLANWVSSLAKTRSRDREGRKERRNERDWPGGPVPQPEEPWTREGFVSHVISFLLISFVTFFSCVLFYW